MKKVAKKKVKNKNPSKKWTKYSLSEGKLSKKKSCPRCGEGTFMAEHKNRLSCGTCHYTEFKEKEQ